MNSTEKVGRCHDCTAPQTEVNILSRHILELQADKGRLTDELAKAKALLQKVVDVCGYPNYDIPVVLYVDISDFLKR